MPEQLNILGVPVRACDMDGAVAMVKCWIAAGETSYVCAADVNSIMQAQRNPAHMAALRRADAVLPDGTPLMWTGRLRGVRAIRRVPGPDLMLALCQAGLRQGWRHYFHGGAEGVADALAAALQQRFPGLVVAGLQSPPFRKLSGADLDQSIAEINAAAPTILWVGLGCPKQEIWMRDNAARIHGAVVIGVGAAFDFHSARIRRAPKWMRGSGLEWLHRLASEPRRLWRRYLLLAPQFVLRVALETAAGRR